ISYRRTLRRGRNLLIFLCLLFSASALLATIADDDSRTESQIQANSTILAWLVEKRQTNCVRLLSFGGRYATIRRRTWRTSMPKSILTLFICLLALILSRFLL